MGDEKGWKNFPTSVGVPLKIVDPFQTSYVDALKERFPTIRNEGSGSYSFVDNASSLLWFKREVLRTMVSDMRSSALPRKMSVPDVVGAGYEETVEVCAGHHDSSCDSEFVEEANDTWEPLASFSERWTVALAEYENAHAPSVALNEQLRSLYTGCPVQDEGGTQSWMDEVSKAVCQGQFTVVDINSMNLLLCLCPMPYECTTSIPLNTASMPSCPVELSTHFPDDQFMNEVVRFSTESDTPIPSNEEPFQSPENAMITPCPVDFDEGGLELGDSPAINEPAMVGVEDTLSGHDFVGEESFGVASAGDEEVQHSGPADCALSGNRDTEGTNSVRGEVPSTEGRPGRVDCFDVLEAVRTSQDHVIREFGSHLLSDSLSAQSSRRRRKNIKLRRNGSLQSHCRLSIAADGDRDTYDAIHPLLLSSVHLSIRNNNSDDRDCFGAASTSTSTGTSADTGISTLRCIEIDGNQGRASTASSGEFLDAGRFHFDSAKYLEDLWSLPVIGGTSFDCHSSRPIHHSIAPGKDGREKRVSLERGGDVGDTRDDIMDNSIDCTFDDGIQDLEIPLSEHAGRTSHKCTLQDAMSMVRGSLESSAEGEHRCLNPRCGIALDPNILFVSLVHIAHQHNVGSAVIDGVGTVHVCWRRETVPCLSEGDENMCTACTARRDLLSISQQSVTN